MNDADELQLLALELTWMAGGALLFVLGISAGAIAGSWEDCTALLFCTGGAMMTAGVFLDGVMRGLRWAGSKR